MSYSALVGEKGWKKLHPEIRERFSNKLHQKVTYKGVMSEVYLSFAGKILALLCRLIGSPLAYYSGKNVPIKVNVYPNEALDGMTWDRFYQFSNQKENRIKSTKCIQKHGLVEMVGFGFGMELDVYEKNGSIVFESSRFFWQIGKLRITIPDLLSPGKTVVSQQALNSQKFQFKLDVTHPILGKVFKQVGIFEEA